jgi:RND family efflux transporter MFP subunit
LNDSKIALLPLAVTLLVTGGCQRAAEPAAPPAMVVTVPVHPDALMGSGALRYPVEVAARYSNTMSFRVGGKLVERRVRLGDVVRKGEVVARLDPIDAEKRLTSARAARAAAEHRLLYARQQLERDQAQSKQNLIAPNQLEQTQDAFSAALASRDEAAADLVVARDALEYNTLVADHDGVITSENADTGQVLSTGQAVFGLAWSGAIDVILDAAAADLGRIGIGQAAVVSFGALPDRRFAALVREIAPAADPLSRTYRVKLTLTGEPGQPDAARDPSGAAEQADKAAALAVRLGMTGDAVLAPFASQGEASSRESLLGTTFTIPSTALFHKGDSPAVWILDPGRSTLELRPVTVRSYSDRASVITAGLNDGDVVVVAGVHAVYAGEHVKPVRPLFDGEGDVEGPMLAGDGSAAGASRAGATANTAPSGKGGSSR